MFQRVVSILVLIGFIAGQLAAVPHAHCGYSPAEQREHDARPHVHVGSHSHDHSHSHSHASGSKSPDSPDYPPAREEVEHDADAVSLPSGVFTACSREDQRTLTSSYPIIAADVAAQLPLPAALAPADPPDVRSPGAKVFLKLRNLRI